MLAGSIDTYVASPQLFVNYSCVQVTIRGEAVTEQNPFPVQLLHVRSCTQQPVKTFECNSYFSNIYIKTKSSF